MPHILPPEIDRRRVQNLLYDLIQRIPENFPEWRTGSDLSGILGLSNDTQRQFGILALQSRMTALANDPARQSEARALQSGMIDLADGLDDRKDFGMALLKLAARMGEVVIQELNRVPEKNFLAFLDFIGMDLLPPVSARVPLTFSLAEKTVGDVSVPAGTKVGVADVEGVVFETEEALFVSRASLSRVYSLNPQQDRFVDLRDVATVGTEGKAVFFDSNRAQEWPWVGHLLYVGHPTLFAIAASAGQPVSLGFGAALDAINLQWEYSTKEGWKPVVPGFGTNSAMRFDIPEISEQAVKGYDKDGKVVDKSNFWIRAKTTQALPLPPAPTPGISSITAGVNISKGGLAPDLSFFNNTPIDLTKDFFPFGERPKFNDTFYIASSEVFSTEKADITLTATFSALDKPDTAAVTLVLEYWDGKTWGEIGTTGTYPAENEKTRSVANTALPKAGRSAVRVADTTNGLRTDGAIRFKCPPIKPVPVNGEENYWIRVRIIAGDYGKEAQYQPTTADDIKAMLGSLVDGSEKQNQVVKLLMQNGVVGYRAETFRPPSLKSLTLGYTYTEPVKSGFSILTANDFVYRDASGEKSFTPFVPSKASSPTLYLGFDHDSAKPVKGTPLSLYFHLTQPRYGREQGSGGTPLVDWHYWSGAEWSRLSVEDETRNFTEGGRVRFIGPAGLTERVLFGESRLWVKASLENGNAERAPKLRRISSNTVWAQHGATFKNQSLGSSNGEPGQSFSFSRSPVLDGQIIEIREPIFPSATEVQRIASEEGPDAIRAVKDDAGNMTEVWVRWHPVSTFNLSTASDRHYVIDRMSGTLLFGDGVRGRIPPPVKDNIMASLYRSGGGTPGNGLDGKVTELRTTFPFIDSVINHQGSAGGSDQEQLEKIMIRGPRQIKTRDRAVTVEDFESLAYQSSSEVAKARCLPMAETRSGGLVINRLDRITVMIIPAGEEDRPFPTERLLKTVKDYLMERALVTIRGKIDPIGPAYRPISVAATVVPKRIEESKIVEKRVFENLNLFLHPIKGGPAREGWEFGRAVYLSEIVAVIHKTEGIDRVQTVTIKVRQEDGGDGQERPSIPIPPDGLPSSGQHLIVSVGGR